MMPPEQTRGQSAMYVLGPDEGIIIAEKYDLAVFFIL
ncbi:MAG: hypothetical protein CM15mP12_0550 [Gammaproteobacteria bacterium]|nr:MAG: hypothetical protein CM15mP12_0550 [Gammaproteobacteria bacterium]